MTNSAPSFDWREIFAGGAEEVSWQHSGVDLLSDGRLIYANPEGSSLVIEDLSTGVRELVKTEAREMHDVVATKDGIWLCDIGHKYVLEGNAYVDSLSPAQILKVDTLGRTLQAIQQPDLPAYEEKNWSPTGITVAPDGDIWVADGYSSYLLLHFDSHGKLLNSFRGDGAGVDFNCPHTVRAIEADGSYQLVVADRANRRLVWLTPEGKLLRVVDHPAMTSPSGITRYWEGLLVTQLYGSLVYVGDDGEVAEVISGPDIHEEKGWPNVVNGEGRPVGQAIALGSVVAPHGITSSTDGEVFFTEWLIGGRVVAGIPRK